jgi:hypothetical protein
MNRRHFIELAVLAPVHLATVQESHLDTVCKKGQGHKQCRYLGGDNEGNNICHKLNKVNKCLIDDVIFPINHGLQHKLPFPLGDSCEGREGVLT